MTAYRVAIPYQIIHGLLFLYSVYGRKISPFSFSFYYSKTLEFKLTNRRSLNCFELTAPRMQSRLCIAARLIHTIENQITSCLKGNRVFQNLGPSRDKASHSHSVDLRSAPCVLAFLEPAAMYKYYEVTSLRYVGSIYAA